MSAARYPPGAGHGRLLVVSHASVLPVNQHVYVRLRELGWDVTLVVPAQWRHEYEAGTFASRPLPELTGSVMRIPVVLAGRPQRHLYLARLSTLLRRTAPDVAFVEEETFSLPAAQWAHALARRSIPFGVQAAENLDRPLPGLARAVRRLTLHRAAFVAARSPAAGGLARTWGAAGSVSLVPHGVPEWERKVRLRGQPFTVGFAGRLVAEKGVFDLLGATGKLDPPVRLLFVGDGPLRAEVQHCSLPNGTVEVWSDVPHDRMPDAFSEMDVLVLPSRTTARWAEQFGRVLVEALCCGVPVIGSSSGEIPWVIQSTSGGFVFPEGDIDALASLLARLRDAPAEREALAARGGEQARALFGIQAAANALDTALRHAIGTASRSARGLPSRQRGRRIEAS